MASPQGREPETEALWAHLELMFYEIHNGHESETETETK